MTHETHLSNRTSWVALCTFVVPIASDGTSYVPGPTHSSQELSCSPYPNTKMTSENHRNCSEQSHTFVCWFSHTSQINKQNGQKASHISGQSISRISSDRQTWVYIGKHLYRVYYMFFHPYLCSMVSYFSKTCTHTNQVRVAICWVKSLWSSNSGSKFALLSTSLNWNTMMVKSTNHIKIRKSVARLGIMFCH